jgi:type IV pilus assembly protein PilY1
MFKSLSARLLVAALATSVAAIAGAQTIIQDDFTGVASSFNWKTFNGACLTAGDGTGTIPKCDKLPYYGTEALVGGNTGTLPDTAGNGALRFTNGKPGGYNQAGSIISNFTFNTGQGLQVTFKTVTYRGDSGGTGKDGADGMSFFLMDGAVAPYDTGATGGSLGYTCSNSNDDPTPRTDGTIRMYDGLAGGYLGLGIDEYGNFLNQGDNTATGFNYVPGRIGLRGAGNVSFVYLNKNFPSMYPSSLTTTKNGTATRKNGSQSYLADQAVYNTCKTGYLWDYSTPTAPKQTTTAVADYLAIPSGYKVLSGVTIANESAQKRPDAQPITYNLKITQDGLLSFSYSYNGGAYQPVITKQSITASNGALPASFRFGFAGSTGGSTNIHEILCFQAAPSETSTSSGSINVYQNPTIKTGTQLFLAYYFPNDWSGQLTAQNVLFDTVKNKVVIGTVPNWDARCILTGVNATTGACSTGVTTQTAEGPSQRTILTFDGTKGVPFQWANLSTAQQNALDSGDATPYTDKRLQWLRGDRTNEINSSGVGLFRARNSVLGDIVDASPTWGGPPQLSYSLITTWVDQLYPSTTMPENSGQKYTAYQKASGSRLNLVFAGSNDGFLHAFRAGSLDVNGNLVDNTATPNDGYEVLAYMPATVLSAIHNSTDSTLDFANTQYAHSYYVDATPASGDVFYGGNWHTWVVGGLGAGGAAFYALDVTDPSIIAETTTAAQKVVIGEWNSSTITCANVSNCGQFLGNTFGTPQVRRFHTGQWGVIFGNGYGSSKGTAGIYVALLDQSSGAPTFYYFSTNSTTGNGIANPASLDIDLDHITDYIYGGDLQGNLWRFDVTDPDPTKWKASANSPLFSAGSSQPITTRPVVGTLKTVSTLQNLAGLTISTAPERVVVNFGTGRQIPQTVTTPTQYASGTQYLYGVWDWDMDNWNKISPVQQAVSLKAPQSVSTSTLQQQTITTVAAAGTIPSYRTVSRNAVCWSGGSGCTPATQFGWYMQLPATGEQIIFDPVLSPDGELVVNTFIPTTSTPLDCKASTSSGFSMGVLPDTGSGGLAPSAGSTGPTAYFNVSSTIAADGVQLNGVGIPALMSSGQTADQNAEYFITQTGSGAAPPMSVNRHVIVTGARLNYLQRR